MPRITKVYTRTGDEGKTSLGTGKRVFKDDVRVQAFGAVDETNAFVGNAIASDIDPKLRQILQSVQNDLFHLGADLCIPESEKDSVAGPKIEQRHVDVLEKEMDELQKSLTPLQNFVLPGGTPSAASLHLARVVCRAAERHVVTLSNIEKVNPISLIYLNRLSDLLFVMARYENKRAGIAEPLWNSHA